MPIVGCYSMDLYCDGGSDSHEYAEFPHVYTGDSHAECARQARRAGWTLDLRNNTAKCPKCSGKKPENQQ